MADRKTLAMDEVNDLAYEPFIALFGSIIEHCSLCAAAVWQNRPFRDVHHIHQLICDLLDKLPDSGKQGILRLHPDLAGKLAGNLTSESQREQKAAGMDTLTPQEREIMLERNDCYKTKFGFPFVICARNNKKDAILDGLKHRLQNSIDEELLTGIEEVKKIGMLRLMDIIEK